MDRGASRELPRTNYNWPEPLIGRGYFRQFRSRESRATLLVTPRARISRHTCRECARGEQLN